MPLMYDAVGMRTPDLQHAGRTPNRCNLSYGQVRRRYKFDICYSMHDTAALPTEYQYIVVCGFIIEEMSAEEKHSNNYGYR